LTASGCGSRDATLPGANLRIAAQFLQPVTAIVTRVRRHRPSPMRALCFQLRQQGGNVFVQRFPLFALSHCETRKTTQ
jgi:hypothetical protein